jgi:hypothetical protein
MALESHHIIHFIVVRAIIFFQLFLHGRVVHCRLHASPPCCAGLWVVHLHSTSLFCRATNAGKIARYVFLPFAQSGTKKSCNSGPSLLEMDKGDLVVRLLLTGRIPGNQRLPSSVSVSHQVLSLSLSLSIHLSPLSINSAFVYHSWNCFALHAARCSWLSFRCLCTSGTMYSVNEVNWSSWWLC